MDTFYWLGLKAVPGIGSVTYRRLLERFDTPEAAIKAQPASLAGVRGVTPAVMEGIASGEWRRFAEEECRRLETGCVRLVTYTSPDYPKSLFEIPDPPPFLYVKGELRSRELSIAIVGSRRATSYGLMTTGKLAEALAGHGICVVSGMARGVDTAAHKGALRAGGRTIGVLGCGVDQLTTSRNKNILTTLTPLKAVM